MEDMSMFDLQPGNNVGGYTLIDRLGGGAMGSVWRVRDDGGNQYAMKILRASVRAEDNENEDSEQERARLRLKREALSLKRIHHPGVCEIVDMELDASIAFIVTGLIEGHNLREDVAENGPYVADDLERLAHKLIAAVKAVHDAGIIHRDIKPTNVMISSRGPVLVDFGIAMGEGESHVTRTGLVMGTPGFIAPEIIEGGDSDEITDWWSVAAVLAFAATGKPVFGTKPMMAVLERAASGNADLTGLPPRTMDAFRKALNPIRQQRCLPSDLEKAISQDAMDPLAWPEANRPFDKNSALGDMRRMWRETTCETTCETLANTTSETLAVTKQDCINNDVSDVTSVISATNARSATSARSVISADNKNYAIDEPVDSTTAISQDVHQISNQPTYVYRGAWILIACLLICAFIACLSVLDSAGLCILMMCVSSTLGYNISARLRRLQLNNGSIPRHDAVIRIASLPWHIIRGLLYSLPRMVGVVIVSCAGAVIYPLLCGTTPELLSIKLGFLNILLPTYSPTIFSKTSVGYSIGFLIYWIILALFKGTALFCLGLGALFGSKKSEEE